MRISDWSSDVCSSDLTPVGLYLPRGHRLATSILAVLRSGGAYLPLSPELPSERVRFILADSGARHVVSMPELVPELPADAALDIIPADDADGSRAPDGDDRSEEHTSELQALMRNS